MPKTALETFWEQIPEILPFSVDSETAIKLYEKYQECKQMEREQMIKAYIKGADMCVLKKQFISGKEYYTQTYGNNNKTK